MSEGPKISREEFKRGLLAQSSMPEEEFDRLYVIRPCDCDYEGCQGWQKMPQSRIDREVELEGAARACQFLTIPGTDPNIEEWPVSSANTESRSGKDTWNGRCTSNVAGRHSSGC